MKAPRVEHDGQRSESAPPSSATPSSLLERLRSPADAAAWWRLLELYGPTVEGWCRRAGLSAEDAADVRQEVFQEVARRISEFRRDRPGDSFRGWLYTTTRRRVLDHRRRAARQPRATGGTDLPVRDTPTRRGEEISREIRRNSIRNR